MTNAVAIACIAGSYLLGSVSFALLFARLVKGIDLRSVGSGNLGATNAGRTLGKGWGLLIYLLDFLKGFGPTWIGLHALQDWDAPVATFLPLPLLMGAASFLGHCYPFYLGFKGGKGVATASGVIHAGSVQAFRVSMVAFVLLVLAFRMISLGSIGAALVLPVAYLSSERQDALALPNLAWLTFFLIVAVFVVVRHRTNIQRIVEGTESRIGSKKS